jgi:replicative DNA helicase
LLYGDVLRARYKSLRTEKAARDRGEDPRTLIKTGLKDFDKKAGLERSILTVIGAPTGEGKSIFKKHLQEYAAQQGLKALDLSFEDPPERSADRTFSTLTGLNNARLAATDFDEDELVRVGLALDEAEDWADNIEYHFGLQTPEACLALVEDSDADLVQVDYAQAFPEGERGLERTIAQFAWDLNSHAQQKRCAVVIYSQLSSEVEKRGMRMAEAAKRRGDQDAYIDGFRPFGASDLAWSNALGQRAKGLGFLFRPGRYRKRLGEGSKDDRMELIWPKKNFGAEGTVTVGFDGKTARLFDVADKE